MSLVNASVVTRSMWCIHLLRDWRWSLTALTSDTAFPFLESFYKRNISPTLDRHSHEACRSSGLTLQPILGLDDGFGVSSAKNTHDVPIAGA